MQSLHSAYLFGHVVGKSTALKRNVGKDPNSMPPRNSDVAKETIGLQSQCLAYLGGQVAGAQERSALGACDVAVGLKWRDAKRP